MSFARTADAIDAKGPSLEAVADEMVARGELPAYRSMACSCGSHPEPNEGAWSGCFVDGDEIKLICGSCWLEL